MAGSWVRNFAAALVLGWVLAGQARAQVPLPNDLTLSGPSRSLPPAAAFWAGAWGGDAWDGALAHMLVVEGAESLEKVSVVYAIGANPKLGIKPAWSRHVAKIEEGALVLRLGEATEARYWPTPDGRIFGRHQSRNGAVAFVVLDRVRHDLAAVREAAGKKPAPLWEPLSVAVHVSEAEPRVLLKGALYRQKSQRPAPTVIFSHGSTDNVARKTVLRPEAMARYLLGQGWAVAAPMRRGRGQSEGQFLEPSDRSISSERQVKAALLDLDATVGALRRRPDVDAKRIVVMGQSRGGLLSILYAGDKPERVAGAVNFAGGWWGQNVDRGFNAKRLEAAGRGARVPTLWLYAANDGYYDAQHIKRNHQAFVDAGGKAELVLVERAGANGHGLINHPALWEGPLSAYLGPFARR